MDYRDERNIGWGLYCQIMDNLIIRELEDRDYKPLAEFNSAFPGDTRSAIQWLNRFNHWWDTNPAYEIGWKRGFLLLDGDLIVGFVGSFPTFFKAGKDIIKVFNGTTWRVLEPYRRCSIDLWTRNREVSKHYLSFNTTPTDDVIRIIKKFKYFLYPWGHEQISFVITNLAEITKRHIPKSMLWTTCLPGVMLQFYQSYRVKRKADNLHVRLLGDDLSCIDDLWQRTKERFTYTNLRNTCAVRWYAQDRHLVGVFSNDRLSAYAIYDIHQHSCHPCMEMTLVDLWHDREVRLFPILSALIQNNMSYAVKNHIAIIKYPHFSADISLHLSAMGLMSKKQQIRGYVRLANDCNLDIDGSNSYFTMLQGDYGT